MKLFLKTASVLLALLASITIIGLISYFWRDGLAFIGSFAIGWKLGDLSVHLHRRIDEHYEMKSRETEIAQWSETLRDEEEE
jgi:hypothetical protein